MDDHSFPSLKFLFLPLFFLHLSGFLLPFDLKPKFFQSTNTIWCQSTLASTTHTKVYCGLDLSFKPKGCCNLNSMLHVSSSGECFQKNLKLIYAYIKHPKFCTALSYNIASFFTMLVGHLGLTSAYICWHNHNTCSASPFCIKLRISPHCALCEGVKEVFIKFWGAWYQISWTTEQKGPSF